MNKIERAYHDRLIIGKRLLPNEISKQWENFVTTCYEQQYDIEKIDIIILIIRQLESDEIIRTINKTFKELTASLGETDILTILDYIAKLHYRGIHLLEYYTQEEYIALSEQYLKNIKKTRELVMKGEDFDDATSIAAHDVATLTIGNTNYQVLINESNIHGVTPNGEIIMGIHCEHAAMIFIISETNKVAYYQAGNKAIEVDSKTGLTDDSISIKINIEETNIETLISAYDKVFNELFTNNLSLAFEINKILAKILTSSTDDEIKNRISIIIEEYIKNQKQLQKQTN